MQDRQSRRDDPGDNPSVALSQLAEHLLAERASKFSLLRWS